VVPPPCLMKRVSMMIMMSGPTTILVMDQPAAHFKMLLPQTYTYYLLLSLGFYTRTSKRSHV
jgi:hypothetical protein